jgi:hypothetical protein
MHIYEVRPRKDKGGFQSDFRCAAIRSAVGMATNCTTIKNRTVGNRTIVRLSLCPLLNLVESEGGRSHLRLRRSDRRSEGVKRREGVFNRQPIQATDS